LLNPYWSMPNPLTIAPEEGPIETLSSTQEERWRQELQHPFTWQRYKTVMEMRRARLKGSQYLLAEALVQPKFWTRMEAVLGLADLGEAADIESIESALGTAPPALVQNYFRRFSRGYTAGELYVMRQAVRLVDAGARLIILQSLAQNRNATNDLYLVAATYDSNGKIKTWIDEELMRSPIGAHVKEEFNHIVATSESDQGATQDAHKLDSAESSKIHDLKIENMQDNVNVEDVYFLKDEDVQPVHKEAVPVDDGFQEIENSAKKRKIKH
ncbi:MAG: HEAT repeat domain-containing protein, partial [Proteobacteria bacterium]|nr:HEAT repeat domain-containing protein [Pseudomonadota bacterium]